MAEGLSKLYQEVLEGRYDCVDRILLNGYFGLCHSAGGFRLWWRQLTGSDETLGKTHLMRLAGRCSRRLRGYARGHRIPVVDGRPGEDKHRMAEEYLEKTFGATGARGWPSFNPRRSLPGTAGGSVSSGPGGFGGGGRESPRLPPEFRTRSPRWGP